MSESARRFIASAFQLGGWLGALGLGLWAVFSFDPSKGEFAPQWVSLGYIGLIGVGLAGTAARSRMRMTDTIIAAMKMGFRISEENKDGKKR